MPKFLHTNEWRHFSVLEWIVTDSVFIGWFVLEIADEISAEYNSIQMLQSKDTDNIECYCQLDPLDSIAERAQ